MNKRVEATIAATAARLASLPKFHNILRLRTGDMALVTTANGREIEVYKSPDIDAKADTLGAPAARRTAKVLPFRDFDVRPEELSNLLERAVGEKGMQG